MDMRTRKLMTMHKALHLIDDYDRLYASRKGGGRELASIRDSVNASIQRLKDYMKKYKGRLITATRNNIDNRSINRTKITRKQKWEENNCMEISSDRTDENSQEKTWTWLRKGNIKREIEFLQIAVQNDAIKPNYIKVKIDKAQQNSNCRLYSDRDETINHIISECSKLLQKI